MSFFIVKYALKWKIRVKNFSGIVAGSRSLRARFSQNFWARFLRKKNDGKLIFFLFIKTLLKIQRSRGVA